ncbi:sarcosine oxidase subunit delta family protein, partial [Streptomyces sp. MBT62]|uniref:sarcosine oxidase subunit delta family protein n=1 Tax=Streptomyces sp. MBT62 TaxID=2800410 RepID=UPI00190BDDAD
MLLIPCPWCGPRDEAEFHYGGQAHVAYPETPADLTDEEWARYLFFRANPKGPFAERWSHAAGCRRWFNAVRDTSTNEILRVYRAGEERPAEDSARPAFEDEAPSGPTGVQGAEPPGNGVEGAEPLEDGTGRGGGGAASISGSAAGHPFRHPTRGRIHRNIPLTFTFDGTEYTGYKGDTLASALLANGIVQTGTSIKLGRPRGIFTAGVEEPNAVIQIEAPFPEPMLPATTVELYDGLVATSLPGQGRLATEPDPARYDAVHTHCDLLVVGAGPAGLAAAAAAARSGARVILADDRPELGGSLLDSAQLLDWVAELSEELTTTPDVRVLPRTTVFGHYDDNHLLAVERRTNHLGAAAPTNVSRERVWRIRARRVVLATGAHERSLAFADNDRPGVMLAASARAYVNRHGVLPGRQAVVFTTNDSAYAAALDLASAGVNIGAIVDTRPSENEPTEWAGRAREAGIEVLTGHAVVATEGSTEGTPRLTAVTVAPYGETTGTTRHFTTDLLLVSGGWNPVAHLFSQAGGKLRYDDTLGSFVPDTCRQAVEVAGSANGTLDLAETLAQGAAAGARAIEAEGYTAEAPNLPQLPTEPATTPAMQVFLVPSTT